MVTDVTSTQVLCGICNEHPAKYKCPKCMVKYCSVNCFKSSEHQGRDIQAEKTNNSSDQTVSPVENSLVKDDAAGSSDDGPILTNPTILAMLKSPSLQVHLSEVAALYQNSDLSGEITNEGRRRVALNKLKQLRPGGKEANAEVEEFVNAILENSDHKKR